MFLGNLGLLPKELLAQIACNTDASSVLSLSRVSKPVRAACYDDIVFRDLLSTAQVLHWDGPSPHLQALADRCGQNTILWARYALADERAWQFVSALGERQTALPNIPSWMIALFAVKHPLMENARLRHVLSEESRHWRNQSELAVLCLQLAVLAVDEPTLDSARDDELVRILQEDRQSDVLSEGEMSLSIHTHLSLLAYTVLMLRRSFGIRRAIWPFDNAARVPLIELPTAAQIPLAPLHSSYALPLPFSAIGDYKQWYAEHTAALWQTEFTTGQWCGYYLWMRRARSDNIPVDPPMSNIHFTGHSDNHGESMEISAADGRDGHGAFTLVGRLEKDVQSGTIRCIIMKSYTRPNGPRWKWLGQLTPFGLVGIWTHPPGHPSDHMLGSFWLWKKAWTETE
nr:hypothetical protein CFP56_32508 [Quercus suber]